ncbi:MAG: RNA polymerase sigma factor [Gemmatimonadota bacterium]
MAHAAIAINGDPGPGERNLIDRVRAGDRDAEYALYRLHAPRVYRLIYRLCGDEDLTSDLTQDAFVRAFSQLERFRGDASFGTWLHRIAVNLTLNARRSEQRRAKWFAPLDAAESAEGKSADIDPDFAQSLEGAIGELTEGQRVVFVMHAMEGYTHVEISEVLGISEGTSKGRLFHARARLRQLLARFAPESEQ